MRPNEKGPQADAHMAAWEALIALFFAMAQIMRLCTEYEQINKSPLASYHQHALVSPDTLSLILPDKLREREDNHNPPIALHGLTSNHQEAQAIAEEWGKEIHACSVGKLASMTKMTYSCEYSTASVDERFVRLKTLDKTTCGLAFTVKLSTPTMEAIADWGSWTRTSGLGPRWVRWGHSDMVCQRILVPGTRLFFVSEQHVIEELATGTLTKRMGTKFITNFTQLMSRAFGREKDVAKTPERKPSSIKQGKFISAANHVRAHVKGFADKLRNLWRGVTDRERQTLHSKESTNDLSLAFKTTHGIQENGSPRCVRKEDIGTTMNSMIRFDRELILI